MLESVFILRRRAELACKRPFPRGFPSEVSPEAKRGSLAVAPRYPISTRGKLCLRNFVKDRRGRVVQMRKVIACHVDLSFLFQFFGLERFVSAHLVAIVQYPARSIALHGKSLPRRTCSFEKSGESFDQFNC